jgi:hypothetical protein
MLHLACCDGSLHELPLGCAYHEHQRRSGEFLQDKKFCKAYQEEQNREQRIVSANENVLIYITYADAFQRRDTVRSVMTGIRLGVNHN